MSHILVIQNAANKEVLTWSGSEVSTHGTTNSANNFYVKMLGPTDQYCIERYNNQSHKLQPANRGSEVCHQSIPTSSTITVWEVERGPSGDSQSGIKLFATNSSGTKWYLRMSAFGGEADLVCQSHVNHEDYDEDELTFDLIAVDVTTIS